MEKSCLILIAGGSGSGKSTVANKLIQKFKKREVLLLKLDDYYKKQNIPLEERVKVNYDHPDSIDFDLALENIESLLSGNAIDKPIYDFNIHQRKDETERIEPSKIIIVEGIFALQDERLRDLADIKIFVDTDSDLRFIRRLKRDMRDRGRTLESVVEQYITTVKPMFEAFVEKTKKFADIIIPNDYSHAVAVEVLENKLSNLVK